MQKNAVLKQENEDKVSKEDQDQNEVVDAIHQSLIPISSFTRKWSDFSAINLQSIRGHTYSTHCEVLVLVLAVEPKPNLMVVF